MPHRRHHFSQRKFKDGVYRLLSSHSDSEERDAMLRRYDKVGHGKLRYIRGEDGKYHK